MVLSRQLPVIDSIAYLAIAALSRNLPCPAETVDPFGGFQIRLIVRRRRVRQSNPVIWRICVKLFSQCRTGPCHFET